MMNKEELKSGILNALHGIDPKTATPQQLHQALGETIMEAIAPDWNKMCIRDSAETVSACGYHQFGAAAFVFCA